jgi:hypothetical protein
MQIETEGSQDKRGTEVSEKFFYKKSRQVLFRKNCHKQQENEN